MISPSYTDKLIRFAGAKCNETPADYRRDKKDLQFLVSTIDLCSLRSEFMLETRQSSIPLSKIHIRKTFLIQTFLILFANVMILFSLKQER